MTTQMLAQFLSLSGMLAAQQRWPSAAREHLHAAEGARCLRLNMQFLRCESLWIVGSALLTVSELCGALSAVALN